MSESYLGRDAGLANAAGAIVGVGDPFVPVLAAILVVAALLACALAVFAYRRSKSPSARARHARK